MPVERALRHTCGACSRHQQCMLPMHSMRRWTSLCLQYSHDQMWLCAPAAASCAASGGGAQAQAQALHGQGARDHLNV